MCMNRKQHCYFVDKETYLHFKSVKIYKSVNCLSLIMVSTSWVDVERTAFAFYCIRDVFGLGCKIGPFVCLTLSCQFVWVKLWHKLLVLHPVGGAPQKIYTLKPLTDEVKNIYHLVTM